MEIAKVLVPVTGSGRDTALLLYAIAAARPFNAHVMAYFVRPDLAEALNTLKALQKAECSALGIPWSDDRLIAVDHRGHIVDGDQLIAVLALDRHARDGVGAAAHPGRSEAVIGYPVPLVTALV